MQLSLQIRKVILFLIASYLCKLSLELCNFLLVYHLPVGYDGHQVESDLSFTVPEEENKNFSQHLIDLNFL